MTRDERRHLCETRHGCVHVRTAGEGGVPLVLLHFAPYSGLAFRRVMPLLAEDRLVVAPDRLGFGFSDPPPRQLDMAEYGLVVLDALDALGIGEFDVVGTHTGAVEAIELATSHPDRVRRVMVVGLPIWPEEAREALRAHFLRMPELHADGSHLADMWQRTLTGSRGRYPDWGNPPAAWTNPDAPAAADGWAPEHIQGIILHALLADPPDRPHVAVVDYPLAERVASVRQPMLVVNTQDDLWPDTAKAEPLLPPNAEFVELPHLDILAFELAPEEMAGRVREFLDARLVTA